MHNSYSCSVTQSCLTLCNPVGRSPLGSSVHGISQARILEWVTIFFSRERGGAEENKFSSHSVFSKAQYLYPPLFG